MLQNSVDNVQPSHPYQDS